MTAQIETFECLSDNYGFLVHDEKSGATAAIDAPDAGAIRAALAHTGWTLSHILVTHHHSDHTDGIAPLKAEFKASVIGPEAEAGRIGGLDRTVSEGDRVSVGSLEFEVLETPGHTLGHVVYFERQSKSLFSGDALFSLGCGRMFEGTPGPMWKGLAALRDLPDETLVYCGHEYSAANAAFAVSIDPDNPALKNRATEIAELRRKSKPTVPFNLGEDKTANPFLRADASELAATMSLSASDPAAVFAAIRKAKDNF